MSRSKSSRVNDPASDAPPRRVVGYVRLSRESEESSSPAKQRQIIGQYASARALGAPGYWELVDVVSDIDVSATKTALDDRPGLTRVRAMVADGTVDAVVVWRLDRLARSVIDYGVLLAEGVDVVSCTEPLDTTSPMGQAMIKILLVFAELESQTIGERLKATIAYRVSQGDRWRGGPTPYGYRSVPHPSGDGKTLVIEPTEAAFARQAADLVLDGASLYKAMTALNEAGAKPRRAEAWSLSSLRVVLTGDSALGRQTRHGQVIRDEHGVIATPWAPILPLEDVERLRAILKPVPIKEARRKASRLLSGVLVCASCGRRMRVNSRRTAGARVESYGCRTNGDGKTCAQPASINADQVEAFVSGELLAVAGPLPVVERREVVRDVAGLAEVEEAIAHTTDAMRGPGADAASLFAQLQSLIVTRDELASRPVDPVVEEFETGETYAERWARALVDERRSLLTGMLMGDVVVQAIGRGYKRVDAERVAVPWRWLDVPPIDTDNDPDPLADNRDKRPPRIEVTPEETVDLDEGESSGLNPDKSARRAPRAKGSAS